MEKVNFYSAAECVFVVSLNPLRILPNLACGGVVMMCAKCRSGARNILKTSREKG